MANYDELIAGARRAEAEGRPEDTKRLLQLALAERNKPAEPVPDGGIKENVGDFARGVGSGLVGASQQGQKLLWKGAGALGFDGAEDMLDIVNAKMADRVRDSAPIKERSPYAFGGGELVGETLFTAPIGGVAGAGAKAAVNASRFGGRLMATGTGLAAEGAAVGSYMAEDGAGADGAMLGAALGVGGGAVINGLTRGGGEVLRTLGNKGAAVQKVDDGLAAANERIQRAAKDGGFTLDGATALSHTRSLDELARLSADPVGAGRVARFRAEQNDGISNRATQIVGKYGDTSDLTSFEGGYKPAQVALTAMRDIEEGAYKSAYRKFDEIAKQTNTRIPTESLYAKLEPLITSPNAASRKIAASIGHDLERYGISATKGPVVSVTRSGGKATGELVDSDPLGLGLTQRLDGKQDPMVPRGRNDAPGIRNPSTTQKVELGRTTSNPYGFPGQKAPEAQKPLTLENVEDLIQDINSHWSPNMSAGEERYMAQIRGALEEHLDSTLLELGEKAGAGSKVYEAGIAARAQRRAFSERWTSNDIIDKVTDRTKSGEWAVDYSKVSQALSGKDAAKHYLKIKARLLTNPDGKNAWRSMQQAPLMEALAAATADTSEAVLEGGAIKFKARVFERVLKQHVKTAEGMEALYGVDGAKEIADAISAWKLQYRKVDTSGSSNPSGTAMTLLKQLRFLPSGQLRRASTSIASSLPVIGKPLERGARDAALDAMLLGKTVPDNIKEEMAADILQQWEDEFIGANGQKYGDVLRHLLTTGSVIQFTEE